jgi:asparagine synthase (glutamine-hydrolysing)
MLSAVSLKESEVFSAESVSNLIHKIKSSSTPSEVDNMALVGILSTQLLFNQFVKDFIPLEKQKILAGQIRNKVLLGHI